MTSDPLSLKIAGLGVRIDLNGLRLSRRPGHYGPFFADSASPDVRLAVVEEDRPTGRDRPPDFEVPGHWRLHRENGRWVIEIQDLMTGRINRVAEMDAGLDKGLLRLGPEAQFDGSGRPTFTRSAGRALASILDPLLRIILLDRLGRQDGLMLHAAAVDMGGIGVVFAGPSGTGKSTLSRLYAAHCPGARIIGDEHIILRSWNGQWALHGSPWPGIGFAVSPGGVPLSRVYVIQHDTSNRIYQRKASATFTELLAQAFLPRWSEEALAGALCRIGELAQGPTKGLGFVNTPDVIEYVAKEIEND